jgi:CRISPR system Cascade subunit CasE
MYLARAQLNPARRGARRLLGSPQAMHAAVLGCFHAGQTPGRVLWRLDPHRDQQWLYVVAADRPDLTGLVEQAGWPSTQVGDIRSYDGFLDRLGEGQRWQFRLTANPTKASREGGRMRGGQVRQLERSKRFGHVTATQQQEWFLTRTSSCGFSIPHDEETDVHDLAVTARRVETFRRGAHRVTLAKATYEGHLVVTDPKALRTALISGVGSAKAYGCGLLTLAAPPHA